MGAAVGRVQGASYCFLPEEDVGRICQVLVDESCCWCMARCWDGSYLFEVTSELGNDFELVPGSRRCCQELAWNSQRFRVDELGHGCLEVHLKCRSHSLEAEGEGVGPTFLPPTHYGGIK